MIVLIKPILMAFLSSSAVKELVIQLLEAYAESTDNTIDDKAVELIKKNLFPGTKWNAVLLIQKQVGQWKLLAL